VNSEGLSSLCLPHGPGPVFVLYSNGAWADFLLGKAVQGLYSTMIPSHGATEGRNLSHLLLPDS
jgi:hypothetical protein